LKNKYFIHLLLFALVLPVIPVTASVASAQLAFGISVDIAPPPLPVYEQPICPGDGYIWTPGYWAYDYDDEDYYWVPGTWVIAPRIGFLWTPGYWGWGDGGYFWHGGYWGEHVGFYGGIDYGFGYGGFGYEGGRWDHDRFYYNTSVNNVNINEVHNTYNSTVINNTTNINNVSYNGGTGGINANPTPAELAANREQHLAATSVQVQHEHLAGANRAQFASVNNGRPSIAATARPAVFSGRGVVAASAAGARPTHLAVNTNRPGNSAQPTSTVNTAPAMNSLAHPSSSTLSNKNGAIQNRNAQRDNAFAHSQINPAHTQGRSLADHSSANRPPDTLPRQQQFNTQSSSRQFTDRPPYSSAPTQRNATNNLQNNSRQFADRPSNAAAPAQRSALNNTQNKSRRFADRPPSSSTPAQRSMPNRTQSDSRQFADRPSYSTAPAQHSVLNNTQGNSRQFANRPPYMPGPQRSMPNTMQNNSRQIDNRPSYSSPAQHSNVTRPQPSPAYHQNPQPGPAYRQSTAYVAPRAPSRQYAAPQPHVAPSYSGRPSPPQFTNGPRQQGALQRSSPQSQPHNDSPPARGNNGRNRGNGR
jgi:hypothetical protein